jgi:hypothetical protein
VRELSQHILDLAENGLQAGARHLEVAIDEDLAQNRLTLRVADDGQGMDAAMLQRVTDPFFTTRTTRRVGLGLPLLKAAAERCNGGLTITSQPGVGTTVVATFQHDHLDRAPLGDVQGSLLGILLYDACCDLYYRHRRGEQVFEFDTAAMRGELGEVSLTHPQVRAWLEEFLAEGFASLRGADATAA